MRPLARRAAMLIAAGAVSLLVSSAASASGIPSADVSLLPGEMKMYDAGTRVPAGQLTSIGRPEDLGGETLEGGMRLSARTDYRNSANGVWAGILESTRGAARYRLPSHVHETVMYGSLEITDQWGHVHRLEPGDAYLARKGTTIRWRARSSVVQTMFLTHPGNDSPAPPLVYRPGDVVAQDQLFALPDPEEMGGTLLSDDDVKLAGRVDLSDAGALGGVFQSTRGDVLIDFPFHVEKGTFFKNGVTMTDELGNAMDFGPGDSYLVDTWSDIVWEQQDKFIQKSFLRPDGLIGPQ